MLFSGKVQNNQRSFTPNGTTVYSGAQQLSTTVRRENNRATVVEVTDPRGNTTVMERTNHDLVKKVTAPAPFTNYTTEYGYDGNDNLKKVRIANIVEDSSGNHVPGTPNFFTHEFTYDRLDNLTSRRLDLGNGDHITSHVVYDNDERVIKVIEGEGNTHEVRYNARDLVTEALQGTSDRAITSRTTYRYNLNSLLTEVIDDDGNSATSTIAYDGFDRTQTVTDERGNQVHNF